MGFHIPDSPPRRAVSSAASQTTNSPASSASSAAGHGASDAGTFRQRFSQRRRNALVPTLSVDVVGSPRSPFVCLSRGHRLALSRQRLRDQAQQTLSNLSTDSESSSSDEQVAKRAPGIRRRSDTLAPSRATLNVFETP